MHRKVVKPQRSLNRKGRKVAINLNRVNESGINTKPGVSVLQRQIK